MYISELPNSIYLFIEAQRSEIAAKRQFRGAKRIHTCSYCWKRLMFVCLSVCVFVQSRSHSIMNIFWYGFF